MDDVVSWIKENVLLEECDAYGKQIRKNFPHHGLRGVKNGKTILEDLSFTAPYKIMAPFEKENGGIQIMPLCASAGIMEGDSQEFSYHVKEGRISRSCRSRLRRSTKWTRIGIPHNFRSG